VPDFIITKRLHFNSLHPRQLFARVKNSAGYQEAIALSRPLVDKSAQRQAAFAIPLKRHLI